MAEYSHYLIHTHPYPLASSQRTPLTATRGNFCRWLMSITKSWLNSEALRNHPNVNIQHHPKESIGRTDEEAEAPLLWPPDTKSQLIRKDPDAGKDWRWEDKGMTEDKVVGWRHWLNGLEFEQAPRVGERQGAWCAAVHGVIKGQTQLSEWTARESKREAVSTWTGFAGSREGI